MKRLLSVLLALTLILGGICLVSCSDNGSDGTTTTTTTKATTTTTRRGDAVEDPEDSDEPDMPFTEFSVGTPEELVDAINKLNSWEVALNSNITLTADLDMSEYSDPSNYEPIYRFDGIFDGAGHTISNLNWTFTMANDSTTNMPTASQSIDTYIISSADGGNENCFAEAGAALLVVHLNGGTIKNLTIKDSSTNIVCSYNKNYQLYTAGLCAMTTSGTVSGVTMENVNVNVPELVNTNQGHLGYAAVLVSCGKGDVVLYNNTVSGTVDTSTNVKFNAAGILGTFPEFGTLVIADCISTATLSVCQNPTSEGLMYPSEKLGGQSDPKCCNSIVEIVESYTPAE